MPIFTFALTLTFHSSPLTSLISTTSSLKDLLILLLKSCYCYCIQYLTYTELKKKMKKVCKHTWISHGFSLAKIPPNNINDINLLKKRGEEQEKVFEMKNYSNLTSPPRSISCLSFILCVFFCMRCHCRGLLSWPMLWDLTVLYVPRSSIRKHSSSRCYHMTC